MYTGETFGVRSRVIDHLFGNIRRSNFRLTVLAALWGSGFWGPAPGRFELQAREVWLTEFLSQHSGGGLRTRRLRQGQQAPRIPQHHPEPDEHRRPQPQLLRGLTQSIPAGFQGAPRSCGAFGDLAGTGLSGGRHGQSSSSSLIQ